MFLGCVGIHWYSALTDDRIATPLSTSSVTLVQEIHALLGSERLLLIHELPEKGGSSSQFREADGVGPGSDLTVYHLRPPDQCDAKRNPSPNPHQRAAPFSCCRRLEPNGT